MGIVAYSPVLPLVDSQVAIYKIYVLKNPFTDEVFYVGQTMKLLEERLYQHMAQDGSNALKVEYIKAIVDQGGKPIIEAIETIKTTCYIDKMAVNEKEIVWIRHYKSIGCNLLNLSAMHPQAKCHEYHSYLSSIKSGSGKYQHYYCGKTIGGHDVYDEERLRADGFALPKPVVEKYTPPPIRYNPYENPRFVKKIWYREDPYTEICNVPCYRDTDPNYYDDDY